MNAYPIVEEPRPTDRAGGLAVPLCPLAWTCVLLAALWLRLGAIDLVPLGPDEAAWALEGRAIELGRAGDYRAQPLVPNSLATSFLLFSPGDGQARLPGALAGAALCLTPLLFEPRIGPGAALGAAALLALSPLSVLAGRTVGPASWAQLAVAVGVGCVFAAVTRRDGRWLLGAGTAVALGLGSGPAFVTHLVALLLAAAIWPPFRGRIDPLLRPWLPRATVVGLVGAVLVDSLLLTRPDGVQAGLIAPLPAWLGSIGLGRGALLVGVVLALHELALLLLAGYGAAVAERRLAGFLAAWAASEWLIGMLSRAPDLGGFAGGVVPLALLGGSGLTRLGWLAQARRPAVRVTAVAALLPVVFLVFMVNGAVQRGGSPSGAWGPLALAAGGLLAVVLIAGAWLERAEVGVALVLALGVVAAALWLTSLTRLNFVGFERGGPALLGQAGRPELRIVEDRARDWWRQDPSGPIRVDASTRPFLEWALRDGPPVEWVTTAPDEPRRAIVGELTAASRPAGSWVRLVVAERYQTPNGPIGPEGLWRWFVQRRPLSGSEPNAILLPQ